MILTEPSYTPTHAHRERGERDTYLHRQSRWNESSSHGLACYSTNHVFFPTFFELDSKLLTTQKRLPHGSCVHAATSRTHSQVSKIAASLAGGLDRGLALRVVVGLAQDHELVRMVQGEGEGDAP